MIRGFSNFHGFIGGVFHFLSMPPSPSNWLYV
jgi:hypothetical protein